MKQFFRSNRQGTEFLLPKETLCGTKELWLLFLVANEKIKDYDRPLKVYTRRKKRACKGSKLVKCKTVIEVQNGRKRERE